MNSINTSDSKGNFVKSPPVTYCTKENVLFS